MVPANPALVFRASVMAGYEMSVSKMFPSRPNFAGEWASELDMSVILSSADNRQFMSGSEERPVSMAWICGDSSS